MKRRLGITWNAKACEFNAHRADFETCPHCNDETPSNEWPEFAKTLVLAIVQGKHTSGAILYECPKCFQESWVHCNLQNLKYTNYPDYWVEAAEKEWQRRHVLSIRNLNSVLCTSCKHITRLEVTTTCHRICKIGFGGLEERCKSYEQAK